MRRTTLMVAILAAALGVLQRPRRHRRPRPSLWWSSSSRNPGCSRLMAASCAERHDVEQHIRERVPERPRVIFHVRKTITCDDGTGTFILQLQARLGFNVGDMTFGPWVVLSGTGRYENLHGAAPSPVRRRRRGQRHLRRLARTSIERGNNASGGFQNVAAHPCGFRREPAGFATAAAPWLAVRGTRRRGGRRTPASDRYRNRRGRLSAPSHPIRCRLCPVDTEEQLIVVVRRACEAQLDEHSIRIRPAPLRVLARPTNDDAVPATTYIVLRLRCASVA